MANTFVRVSALIIASASIILSAEPALAAIPPQNVDASQKSYCKYLATIEFYAGAQRSAFIKECLANNGLPAIGPLHQAHR